MLLSVRSPSDRIPKKTMRHKTSLWRHGKRPNIAILGNAPQNITERLKISSGTSTTNYATIEESPDPTNNAATTNKSGKPEVHRPTFHIL